MTETDFDVVIIGAGPTGASLGLALAQAGLQTGVIDARDPKTAPRPDGRNFAIVTGSWRLLRSIGITDKLEATSEPLHGLEAVDGGTHWFGRPSVLFTDADLDSADPDETLGHMVQADPLQNALDEAMDANPHLTRLAPARFAGLKTHSDHVEVELEAGRKLKAALLVGADGMRSPVRKAHNIPVEGRDYEKSVFTANIKLSRPHDGIARQLFVPEGPFALLPLQNNRANLAWYMKRGAAEALTQRSVEDAEAELNARFADFAGKMKIEGEMGTYPLILQLASQITAPRTALIGDAARRVNPLAGQGLNQGFRDVAALIETVTETLRIGGDIGADMTLEAYSRARRFDGTVSALALDGIDRLFSNDAMLAKPLRGLGLYAASQLGPLRRALARKASACEDGVPSPMQDH